MKRWINQKYLYVIMGLSIYFFSLPCWTMNSDETASFSQYYSVQGNGYVPFTTPNGQTIYTRHFALHLNEGGELTSAEGYLLGNGFSSSGSRIAIHPSGNIVDTSTNPVQTLGHIQLAYFCNEDMLKRVGDHFVAPSFYHPDPVMCLPQMYAMTPLGPIQFGSITKTKAKAHESVLHFMANIISPIDKRENIIESIHILFAD